MDDFHDNNYSYLFDEINLKLAEQGFLEPTEVEVQNLDTCDKNATNQIIANNKDDFTLDF